MGSSIVRFVRDADDMKLVGATERPGSAAIGLDVGLACRLGAGDSRWSTTSRPPHRRGRRGHRLHTPRGSPRRTPRSAPTRRSPWWWAPPASFRQDPEEMKEAPRAHPLLGPQARATASTYAQAPPPSRPRLGDATMWRSPSSDTAQEGRPQRHRAAAGGGRRRGAQARPATTSARPAAATSASAARRRSACSPLRGGNVVGETTVFYIGEGERWRSPTAPRAGTSCPGRRARRPACGGQAAGALRQARVLACRPARPRVVRRGRRSRSTAPATDGPRPGYPPARRFEGRAAHEALPGRHAGGSVGRPGGDVHRGCSRARRSRGSSAPARSTRSPRRGCSPRAATRSWGRPQLPRPRGR
jgi:hypothetical protein